MTVEREVMLDRNEMSMITWVGGFTFSDKKKIQN